MTPTSVMGGLGREGVNWRNIPPVISILRAQSEICPKRYMLILPAES